MGLTLAGCGKASDSLTITAISPPPGSAIDSSTQFSVTFHYVLQDNEKGHDPSAYTICWVVYNDVAAGAMPVGPLDQGLSGTVTFSFQASGLPGFTPPYHLRFELYLEDFDLLATSETVTYTAP
jgi:hypothetical protein